MVYAFGISGNATRQGLHFVLFCLFSDFILFRSETFAKGERHAVTQAMSRYVVSAKAARREAAQGMSKTRSGLRKTRACSSHERIRSIRESAQSLLSSTHFPKYLSYVLGFWVIFGCLGHFRTARGAQATQALSTTAGRAIARSGVYIVED